MLRNFTGIHCGDCEENKVKKNMDEMDVMDEVDKFQKKMSTVSISSTASTKKRRGVILVLVLVVIALASLSVVMFSRLMRIEAGLASHALRQRQSRLLAESGIEYCRFLLQQDETALAELGGIYDNEAIFCGQIVTERIAMSGASRGEELSERTARDPRDCGRFSIIAPALSTYGELSGEVIRYGLEDESCKINLHWLSALEKKSTGAAKPFLLKLPAMTSDLADAILDWLDEDDESRVGGAETDYYAALEPPYQARNAVPDAIDELLLVRGMTPAIFYGVDANRNGLHDWGETEDFTTEDGTNLLGLASYFTVDSRETIYASDGEKKININASDATALKESLTERFPDNPEWSDYIAAYKERYSSIPSILHLVGNPPSETSTSTTQNTSQNANSQNAAPLKSPFALDVDAMREYLPLLYDYLTTSDTPLVGRINLNQASRAVLEIFALSDDETELWSELENFDALETLESTFLLPEILEEILSARISDSTQHEEADMQYPYWLYTLGIIEDFEQMKKLDGYFCTRGAVFRGQVVGRFDDARSPATRLEFWLDHSEYSHSAADGSKPVRILRQRSLDDLGPGYGAAMLGCEVFAR